jgi:hypothetical protein
MHPELRRSIETLSALAPRPFDPAKFVRAVVRENRRLRRSPEFGAVKRSLDKLHEKTSPRATKDLIRLLVAVVAPEEKSGRKDKWVRVAKKATKLKLSPSELRAAIKETGSFNRFLDS